MRRSPKRLRSWSRKTSLGLIPLVLRSPFWRFPLWGCCLTRPLAWELREAFFLSRGFVAQGLWAAGVILATGVGALLVEWRRLTGCSRGWSRFLEAV